MQRSGLLISLIAGAALGSASCQPPTEQERKAAEVAARARSEASRAALAFLNRFSEPTPENEAAWRLRGFSVYGRPSVANPAGVLEARPVPGGYRVEIPVWVEGTDGKGQVVHVRRRLALDATEAGDGTWVANGPRFTEVGPLESGRLFLTRAVGGLIALAVFAALSFWIWWIITAEPPEPPSRRREPSRRSAPSSTSGDPVGCFVGLIEFAYNLFWLGYILVTMIAVWVAALIDPDLRVGAVCVGLALVCWILTQATSIRLFGILGVLALGFPVLYLAWGFFGSALAAAGLFAGAFLLTTVLLGPVWVGRLRKHRQELAHREFAEFMARYGQ